MTASGGPAISTESLTRDIAHRYLDAWTCGDLDEVRRLLAEDVSVESNVGGPGSPARFVDTLGQLAVHLVKASIVAESYSGGQAVLMYDCLISDPVGAVRMVDFLDVADGAIAQIRQVYDVVALRRLLPGFGA